MHEVAVRILHPPAGSLKPLEAALLAARAANADRLTRLFRRAGAADVSVVTDQGALADDAGTFGGIVRTIAASLAGRGLVLLGSGAIPLATANGVSRLVGCASSGERQALANNRYSADVIAIGDPSALLDLPDLPGDNAVPRWLDEVAGFEVADLRGRWRLAVDLDSPLDVLLVGGQLPDDIDVSVVEARLAGVRKVARDPRAELVIAGRTSARTLGWLERRAAARIRALVEERGLRASSAKAQGTSGPADEAARRARPPRSALGMAIDARGPEALGAVLAELGDAAIVDSRVLLAHRLGADERLWPVAEDRFASDLLLADRIADPWLRDLTASAAGAPIPVVLGGHTLVGPGIRLLLARRKSRAARGRARSR